IPESEEDRGDNLYHHVHEDPASPSSITTIPESMDSNQESSEGSCSNSVASQQGADGEAASFSSHRGAEEDHPYQETDLMRSALEDRHIEDMMFERKIHFPPDFQLRRSQSTSSSPTSLKFPLGNNSGGTDNFQEDSQIFMFVK
ncbi:hypothetical protein N331_02916, partial [Merops nubicus]